MQVLYILHRLRQDIHLAELLYPCRRGDVSLEHVEPVVHVLHPVALPRVSLNRLEVLLRFDPVPVYRVYHDRLPPWTHFTHTKL